jgi:hypothetical protein
MTGRPGGGEAEMSVPNIRRKEMKVKYKNLIKAYQGKKEAFFQTKWVNVNHYSYFS